MTNELIRLIDPESAHAIEETAKAAGKAVDVRESCINQDIPDGDLRRSLRWRPASIGRRPSSREIQYAVGERLSARVDIFQIDVYARERRSES